MFVFEIGGWVILSCILTSFIEHQVHRKLMHRENFLSAHTASFKRVFEAHAQGRRGGPCRANGVGPC